MHLLSMENKWLVYLKNLNGPNNPNNVEGNQVGEMKTKKIRPY